MVERATPPSPLSDVRFPRLRPCPPPDKGVHPWTYYAACTLVPYVPTERDEELETFITARMTRVPDPASEVMDSIRSARHAEPGKRRKRVDFDEFRARALAARLPIADYASYLAQRSPVDCGRVSIHEFFELLYRPGEIVRLFANERSQGWQYVVGERRNLDGFGAGEDGAWFLANPVNGKVAVNPRTGRSSRRSKENLTAHRYGLIESDQMSENEWTAILAQLPLPIVSVTHSAGKSLHALVRVDAPDAVDYERIREGLRTRLVPLGACESSLSSVRLTRLPGYFRRGREQKLLFLNPAPTATPINALTEGSRD